MRVPSEHRSPAAGSGGLGGNAISGTGFTVVGNNTNTVKGAI